MLVHRSTESLVIERLDIPATESPSVERDSFIFLDEDYRELEHDELSPVKTRKITRTMGTMVLWFLQLPQGRVHIRVRHSWSEESLEENLPDDLWSWEMSFTKGPSRGTRPSLLNRKKELARNLFIDKVHATTSEGEPLLKIHNSWTRSICLTSLPLFSLLKKFKRSPKSELLPSLYKLNIVIGRKERRGSYKISSFQLEQQ